MKDFYTRKSKQEGYYARSVYKLKHMNKKYNLIRKGDKVLDLGCSPGGWVQASLEIIGNKGLVVGVDITPARVKAENFKFIKADVKEAKIEEKFDTVISDMAPKTTGIQELDHERSYDLAKTALEIAKKHLKEKGNFLCKIFQGKYYQEFLNNIRENFEFVKTVKPEASKKESKEMYVVGKCLKHKKE